MDWSELKDFLACVYLLLKIRDKLAKEKRSTPKGKDNKKPKRGKRKRK